MIIREDCLLQAVLRQLDTVSKTSPSSYIEYIYKSNTPVNSTKRIFIHLLIMNRSSCIVKK